nr:putative octanoyltransferase [Quercus suber]
MAVVVGTASRIAWPVRCHELQSCIRYRTFSVGGKQSFTLTHHHVTGIVPYANVAQIQESLVQHFLSHKADVSKSGDGDPIPPNPTVITAQFEPVYTCGRREVGTVTAEQRTFLTEETPWGVAQFHEALRGGQTTFHGPGQLVAYPVLDLRRYGIRPRCYVNMLEQAVIATLRHYGVAGNRSENPGVWVGEDDKICALGVHLRRNITSHGIGLNVSTELGWFGRIVACGLEGKGTTTLQREHDHKFRPFGSKISMDEIAKVFVQQFAEALREEANISLDSAVIESSGFDT